MSERTEEVQLTGLSAGTGKPVVFVVDDAKGYTDIVQEVLEEYGLEVHTSNGAFRAAEMMGRITPDLILLDIMMPSVDGISFLRHLRRDESRSSIPVLIVSAFPETREEALAAGADGFLAKPFTAQNLRKAIDPFLEIAPQS